MIKIQVESFNSVYNDIQPLWKKHYDEIIANKDIIDLNPNIDGYKVLDENDALVIFAVRDDGKLIGYSFFVLQYSLHCKQVLIAINDLFFIDPEYRGKFLGPRLIREAESVFKRYGIHQIQMRTKVYANFGPILEREGYAPDEVAYMKTINNPKQVTPANS